MRKGPIKAAHEVYVNCVKILQLWLNRHLGGVNAHALSDVCTSPISLLRSETILNLVTFPKKFLMMPIQIIWANLTDVNQQGCMCLVIVSNLRVGDSFSRADNGGSNNFMRGEERLLGMTRHQNIFNFLAVKRGRRRKHNKVLVTNDSDNLKEHFVDAFASLKAAFKI